VFSTTVGLNPTRIGLMMSHAETVQLEFKIEYVTSLIFWLDLHADTERWLVRNG